MNSRTRIPSWAEPIAGPLELELSASDSLVGRHRGAPVRISREDGACWVRVELTGPLPPGFSIETQLGPGLRDQRGDDIVVGDPELDRRVRVQAMNPAAAIRILREPEVKRAALELFARFPAATIRRSSVELPMPGEPAIEEVRAALQLAAKVAQVLDPAAEREAKAHAAKREEAKEQETALPSRRFSRDPAFKPRTHAARALQRNLGVAGSGLGIGLYVAASWFGRVAHSITSGQAVVLGVLGAIFLGSGLFALSKVNLCFSCGESLLEPRPDGRSRNSIYLQIGRCRKCGGWNA